MLLSSRLNILKLKVITLQVSCISILTSLLILYSLHKCENKVLYINSYIGIDYISIYFILLSNLLTIICIITAWHTIKYLIKEFYICLLLTNLTLIVIFTTINFIVFYIVFEIALVPVFVMISLWGAREQKIKASYYFFLFTMVGGVMMLYGLIILYNEIGSLSLITLSYCIPSNQNLICVLVLFSITIKIPMFPVHI